MPLPVKRWMVDLDYRKPATAFSPGSKYGKAVRVVGELQRRLGQRVSIWSSGQTWEGEPTIGLELPGELFECIDADVASELENELKRFRDRVLELLRKVNG